MKACWTPRPQSLRPTATQPRRLPPPLTPLRSRASPLEIQAPLKQRTRRTRLLRRVNSWKLFLVVARILGHYKEAASPADVILSGAPFAERRTSTGERSRSKPALISFGYPHRIA